MKHSLREYTYLNRKIGFYFAKSGLSTEQMERIDTYWSESFYSEFDNIQHLEAFLRSLDTNSALNPDYLASLLATLQEYFTSPLNIEAISILINTNFLKKYNHYAPRNLILEVNWWTDYMKSIEDTSINEKIVSIITQSDARKLSKLKRLLTVLGDPHYLINERDWERLGTAY